MKGLEATHQINVIGEKAIRALTNYYNNISEIGIKKREQMRARNGLRAITSEKNEEKENGSVNDFRNMYGRVTRTRAVVALIIEEAHKSRGNGKPKKALLEARISQIINIEASRRTMPAHMRAS